MQELDVVTLTRPVRDSEGLDLPAGTQGAIVMLHPTAAYVEFVDENGRTLGVPLLPLDALRPA